VFKVDTVGIEHTIPYLQWKAMEEEGHPTRHEPKKLLALREQLRRKTELAKEKGIPTMPGKRKLAAVNKERAKIKDGDTKGGLFDTQLDLF
jgi:hypothetical protein